jgi:hypothetical protein
MEHLFFKKENVKEIGSRQNFRLHGVKTMASPMVSYEKSPLCIQRA